MSRQPKLSICIPTYNRLHYLREMIEELLPQIEGADVEVFVSDNCSSDGTREYIESRAKENNSLHYQINQTNIGLEKNMIAAISGSRGEFVLPIGDDEVLPRGSIELILGKIIGSEVDLLVLNGWHTDNELRYKYEHLPPELQEKTFCSPEKAFAALWNKTPPGSFVVKKDLIQEHNLERFLGTSHAYAGAIWAGLSDIFRRNSKCDVRCLGLVCVLLRGGEKTWSDQAARIMLYEIPIWFRLLEQDDVYRDTVSSIMRSYLSSQTSFRNLIRYRAYGGLDFEIFCEVKNLYSCLGLAKIRLFLWLNRGALLIVFRFGSSFRNFWRVHVVRKAA